jgi:hypothetical protein
VLSARRPRAASPASASLNTTIGAQMSRTRARGAKRLHTGEEETNERLVGRRSSEAGAARTGVGLPQGARRQDCTCCRIRLGRREPTGLEVPCRSWYTWRAVQLCVERTVWRLHCLLAVEVLYRRRPHDLSRTALLFSTGPNLPRSRQTPDFATLFRVPATRLLDWSNGPAPSRAVVSRC